MFFPHFRTIDGCCTGYFRSIENNKCESKLFFKTFSKWILSIYDLIFNKGLMWHNRQLFAKNGNFINFKFYLVLFLLECIAGYIGLNCTTTCPYPSYGKRCQGYCNCSNETCDVSTGCTIFITGMLDFQTINAVPLVVWIMI